MSRVVPIEARVKPSARIYRFNLREFIRGFVASYLVNLAMVGGPGCRSRTSAVCVSAFFRLGGLGDATGVDARIVETVWLLMFRRATLQGFCV